jgi:ATP-binding cassette, subfamily B, bacterial
MGTQKTAASTCTPLEYRYQSKRPLATLWLLFREQRLRLGGAALLYIIKHSPAWLIPVFFARMIGIMRQPELHEPASLFFTVGLMLVFLVQNVPSHMAYVRLMSMSVRHVECALREALVRRLQQLSITFHANNDSGRLHTKLLRDVEAVQGLAHQLIESVLNGTVGIIFAFGVTMSRDPRATILYLVMVPMAVGLHRGFRKRIESRNRAFRSSVEDMSAKLAEMIDMIPVTRAHGLEDSETERISSHLQDVRHHGLSVDMINALFGSIAWVGMQIPQILFLGISGWFCYRTGSPSVEDVILFWGLFQMILGSVNALLNTYPAIARGFESIRSIGEVLECPDIEVNEGKRAVKVVQGGFRLDHVCYRYMPESPWALDGVSLDVAPGEHVAFVGTSGSGKTTIMNLIIGFRRPTMGHIFLDGRDMQDLDLRMYRRNIAVIPQDTILFSGSIRDNITYGIDRIDENRLEEVLEAANIMEFARDFPEGLDTLVGEHGARISGGQRQRIAIARAFMRDPRVILMDEATSALDPATEQLVQEAIERLIAGRTVFVVAHRLATVRRMDRIVVLEHGKIVESGSYAELIAKRSAFFAMNGISNG